MWKVVLTFVTQRFLLLLVALAAINQAVPQERRPGSILPQIQPTSVLWNRLLEKVGESPEANQLDRLMQQPKENVFQSTSNPFLWLARWMVALTRLSPVLVLLLLSNIFLLGFLWELNALFNRMATAETAATSTIFVLLWPTTYQLSLGSTLAMTCCLVALSIRHALDNRWLVTGFSMAGLALMDPLVLGLMPLILYLFWYFQRHFPVYHVVRRSIYFLVPAGLAIGWRFHSYSHLGQVIHESALFNAVGAFRGMFAAGGVSWPLVAQLGALVFFAAGAVAALVSNTTLVHRIIPANMLLLLVLFSPFASLATRAPIAGVCLEGIASASSRGMARARWVAMVGLGAFEVFRLFG
jgi:hypothetical protein